VTRIKASVAHRQRHKKVLKITKGQYDTKHRLFRRANEAMLKSMFYSTRDRRVRKRDMRRLWIVRINAAARENGLSYSRLINGLRLSGVDINRKMLAEVAVSDPQAFASLARMAGEARA
jgi:large subunit ribosomal protein L20